MKTLGPKSQTQMLLDHFQKRGDISGLEAAAMFRIRALPRRIKDLEERGHRFHRDTKKDTTGQRYTRYTYLGAAAESSSVYSGC